MHALRGTSLDGSHVVQNTAVIHYHFGVLLVEHLGEGCIELLLVRG